MTSSGRTARVFCSAPAGPFSPSASLSNSGSGKREAAAALVIQKTYRRHLLGRRFVLTNLLDAQRRREEAKITQRARAMYAVWRREEDETPQGKIVRLILMTGAASIIQRAWRRILQYPPGAHILREYKRHWAACTIQKCMRGCWGRRYAFFLSNACNAAARKIQIWHQSNVVKWASSRCAKAAARHRPRAHDPAKEGATD